MAVEDSIPADDQLAAFIDRILRMKEEADAIAADIREIYAEAKAAGFDKTRLGDTVTKARKVAKDANAEAEKEALNDLYWTAYCRAKNKPHAHAYARGEKEIGYKASNSGLHSQKSASEEITRDHDAETGEITEPQPTKAAGQVEQRAALAISGERVAATSSVENEAAEISTPITEQQEDCDPARDLTASPKIAQGQVAPIQPGTANEKAGDVFVAVKGANARLADAVGVEPSPAANSEAASGDDYGNGGQHVRPADDEQHDAAPVPGAVGSGESVDGGDQGQGAGASVADRGAGAEPGTVAGQDQDRGSGHVGGEAHYGLTDTGKPVEASASAAPGVVMETTPFYPATRPHYHDAFPEILGKDFDALVESIREAGVRQPIIRMGTDILDGWARYNAARSLGIAYPVVPYLGNDVLLDIIGWQRRDRQFTPAQERSIAAKLAKAVPHRADDIMQAFGLEVSEAAQ